jgi:hypothetical protein
VRRVRRRKAPPSPEPRWIVAEHNPEPASTLDDFRFFAIIGTWMEEDVVGATVANALTQGCERVYLVDNESSDGTVREAVAAGAVLAESFATDEYEETTRLEIMNRVVSDVSIESAADHVWWLWLDADEFPHGPKGLTLREHLELLDQRFRIVGTRFMNHFPDREPAYEAGRHPLDFQPMCEEHTMNFVCPLRHRKHPLQRFDRARVPITSDRGFHRAWCDEQLVEPVESIFTHHFPYRNPDVTRARLSMLCERNEGSRIRIRTEDDAVNGMVSRYETLDAVYRQDWDHVQSYFGRPEFSVARPELWTALVDAEDARVQRWYDRPEIDA